MPTSTLSYLNSHPTSALYLTLWLTSHATHVRTSTAPTLANYASLRKAALTLLCSTLLYTLLDSTRLYSTRLDSTLLYSTLLYSPPRYDRLHSMPLHTLRRYSAVLSLGTSYGRVPAEVL